MELSEILRNKLNAGDNIVTIYDGALVQGWPSDAHRFLALIEHRLSFAIFVCVTTKSPPLAVTDVAVNIVVPIDCNFKCEISFREIKGIHIFDDHTKCESLTQSLILRDPITKCQELPNHTEHPSTHKIFIVFINSQDTISNDIYMDISAQNLKLLIGMKYGNEIETFFTALSRSMDIYEENQQTLDFQWLKNYSTKDFDLEFGLISPNIDVTPSNNSKATTNKTVFKNDSSFTSDVHSFRSQSNLIQQKISNSAKNFSIYVGTWNVNDQPTVSSLNTWLTSDSEPPDIYVIGFQELDLNKNALLFNDSPREEDWLKAVTNSLNSKGHYKNVSLIRLVGIMIILFVKQKHILNVTNIATDTVSTGFMGILGNKGAVAVRMDFHNTSLCFVNCHFTAHIDNIERRDQEYYDICSQMVFSSFTPPKTIKDHDQVYWFGDLNSRITEMDAILVKNLQNKNSFKTILEADQLKQQLQAGHVFKGYMEGLINFLPTYEYDPSTNDHNKYMGISEKDHVSAWCDRILWRGDSIKQLNYKSYPDLLISNHKPVSALFEFEKAENKYLPQVMVDTEIIFNTVHFMEPEIKKITVTNVGQFPVKFEFQKRNDSTYCKKWLRIEPLTSLINPGKTCDVSLEVLVDKRSAHEMNSGEDKLEDNLVLYIDGKNNININVTGTYERSCFGCSLKTLCYLRAPIRDIPIEKLEELEINVCNLVPKEVWHLTDYLNRHGLKQKHLFEQSGSRSEFIQIRNWLDNGHITTQNPLSGSVHSVAETLLILLDSTPEPIIPYKFHTICLSSISNFSQCKLIISQLPEQSKNAFIYLCTFLKNLLNHVEDNNLDVKTIAFLFGRIFIRDPVKNDSDKFSDARTSLSRKRTDFMYNFLVNDN